MRYLPLLFLSLLLFVSCNDAKEKEIKKTKEKVKKEPIIKEYGFIFNDYKVIKDTIRTGDNLSLIFEKFNLPDSIKTFEAVENLD